jgi:hypothetical protein
MMDAVVEDEVDQRSDDLREAVRAYELFGIVREAAPEVFTEPVPLAIGVDKELIELGLTFFEARRLLRWWCGQPAYQAALAAVVIGGTSTAPRPTH